MRSLRGLLAVGAWVWVAALVLWPSTVFPLGAFVCHQRPERSFFLNGHQLAVCARCTGLYVGAAFAVPWVFTAMALPSARARVILALAAVPTALTWTLEMAGLLRFSNVIRFAAAIPLGVAAAWLVFSVLQPQSPRQPEAAAS